MSAFSPLVDPEAERATGRKGMVMWAVFDHAPAGRPRPLSANVNVDATV